MIYTKADKIHTVINAGEEAVELTDNNTSQIDKYLEKPNFGLPFPWYMYNEYFLGMRETKLLFEGFLSNEGKTRKLVLLAAYVALVQNENFFLMSNEMDEEDLRSCLITTVINNKEFQELEAQRKQIKNAIMEKYNDFETLYKEKVSYLYNLADEKLKAKILSVEDELKKEKEEEIREFFEEHCKDKNVNVQFERMGLNITLSASMKSLKEQTLAFIEKIASDLKLIE